MPLQQRDHVVKGHRGWPRHLGQFHDRKQRISLPIYCFKEHSDSFVPSTGPKTNRQPGFCERQSKFGRDQLISRESRYRSRAGIPGFVQLRFDSRYAALELPDAAIEMTSQRLLALRSDGARAVDAGIPSAVQHEAFLNPAVPVRVFPEVIDHLGYRRRGQRGAHLAN
jgi:hypothetical protein